MQALKINDYRNWTIDDHEVIKRILGGEKELFEILLRRNNQKLYRVVRSYLKDENEVSDIMQNTYLRAYQSLYTFNFKSQFSTWLIRIAINEALRRIESYKRNLFTHIEAHPDNKKIVSQTDSEYSNPEEKLIRKEAGYLLEKAIDKLEAAYSTPYILFELEGMKISEIAEVLNLSTSNIKVRIHRARQMLKEILYGLSNDRSIFEFGSSRCDNMVEQVMMLL
jgi:RNA polymerase sigma-70 factor (ECF subfamily)